MHKHRKAIPFKQRQPLAAAVLLAAIGQPTQAAEPAPQATSLDAVTVTATRRESTLQEVPVAVSVVDGEQLERDNRNNVAS
ncbi:MAG TPA: TonB-dependent receptor, partial [Pseudomonas sp.]|nr:TonB-dependent receptor [Pseudomonas sp.]